MKSEVVLAGAVRTPLGRFMGGLAALSAPELGAVAIREAVRRAGIEPKDVEEVLMGNVLQAGLQQNPARQAALAAGLPDAIGSVTINKVCGSGLKAVVMAAQAIQCGDADIVVAGGQESMTNAPHMILGLRTGTRLGHAQLLDSMVHDGLWDKHNDFHMGMTAELVAEKYGLTRQQQDEFALGSHRKAVVAQKEGKFAREIIPVEVPQRKKEPIKVDMDEGPREDTSLETLAKLRPAFKKDGTVTPGNASSINDGASAMVVLSAEKARQLGVKPQARILGYATGGLAPEWVMMAPREAVRNLEKRTGLKLQDFDLYEFNEPFAAASVQLQRELELEPAKLNVHGGAVALGHPIGCTGARILTTLLYAMEDRGANKGLATLCLGGGNAVAMAVERLD